MKRKCDSLSKACAYPLRNMSNAKDVLQANVFVYVSQLARSNKAKEMQKKE